MEALFTAALKFLYDKVGMGLVIAILAIAASVWVTWHAKIVLDGVAQAINRLAGSQEKANEISIEQQRLCRCHAESQETLVDSMRSLVQEVHVATTTGARTQETNMRAVLDVLQHVLDKTHTSSDRSTLLVSLPDAQASKERAT